MSSLPNRFALLTVLAGHLTTLCLHLLVLASLVSLPCLMIFALIKGLVDRNARFEINLGFAGLALVLLILVLGFCLYRGYIGFRKRAVQMRECWRLLKAESHLSGESIDAVRITPPEATHQISTRAIFSAWCGPLAVLGFFIPLVIIAWGPFQKARQVAQRNACGENLQAIVVAKAKWAEEKGKTDVPNEKDLRPYLPSKFSKCPAGGDYTINFTNKAPTCSVADHRLPKH